MSRLPDDIVTLIEGDKYLGSTPNWDDLSDPKHSVFTVPLTIGAVVTGGFRLRAKVSKRWADRDALLQLEFAAAGRRTDTALWRLDWKPIHTHTNSALPKKHAWEVFTDSHQHMFTDNYLPTEQRMRTGNLPGARPFPSNPNTLSDFLALGGKLFRIKDINRVLLPTIGTDLFWQDDE